MLTACGAPSGSGDSAAGDAADTADAAVGGAACPQPLPSSCPAPLPSYQSEVAPIVARRCLICHGPGGIAYPDRDFTSYDKVYSRRASMLSQIHGCSMPPVGATPLSAQEQATLLAWFVCGAPNN